MLLILHEEGIYSLSTTTATKRRVSAPRKIASPPRKANKAWQKKSSRWDVRHSRSFRFQIRAPSSGADSWDVMPLHKKPSESLSHVLGKGFLWSLFKEQYGSQSEQIILVETPIPEETRFIPDVVAFQDEVLKGKNPNLTDDELELLLQRLQPTFWGESGRMSAEKAAALAAKYPHTHFVHFRWGSQVTMDIFEEIENAVLPTLHHRTAPFQFALIPDEPKRLMAEDGAVLLQKNDVQWRTAGFDIDLNY